MSGWKINPLTGYSITLTNMCLNIYSLTNRVRSSLLTAEMMHYDHKSVDIVKWLCTTRQNHVHRDLTKNKKVKFLI